MKTLLSKDIPGFIQIDGFDWRVWYSCQLSQCSVGHGQVIVPRPALSVFFVGCVASPATWPRSVCGFSAVRATQFRLITRWRRRRKLFPLLRLFLILLLLYLLVLKGAINVIAVGISRVNALILSVLIVII